MTNRIKTVELFAGVGGFRLGLEGWYGKSPSSSYTKTMETSYEVIWSNQWEPLTKMQHASMVYENRFGKFGHSNFDIETVPTDDIPDHDLLVGGFPCQDYSVATTLKNAKGLIGKKGVLWWSIHRILSEKQNRPKYLLLENVDRLLKSPASQRGRDFAIMLRSISDLGYAVEWRVINAADYGMPQRRRRVFFIGYHKDTNAYKELSKEKPLTWILRNGTLAKAFPVSPTNLPAVNNFQLSGSVIELSNNFGKGAKVSDFENTGMMIDGNVYTLKTFPEYDGNRTILKDVLVNGIISAEFFVDESQIDKWKQQKGGKSIERLSSNGFVYRYSEGGMNFPDDIEKPSRTIITGEGGKTPSRFKHVIKDPRSGQLRRLTPLELERLNMFPDNFTEIDGMSSNKRAFFMGNALVVGVVEKIGNALNNVIINDGLGIITNGQHIANRLLEDK